MGCDCELGIGVVFIASGVVGQADSRGAVGRARGEWRRWRGGLGLRRARAFCDTTD